MAYTGGTKAPCYRASLHPEVSNDLDDLTSNGFRKTIGKVVSLIAFDIDNCVSPSDADAFEGSHLLYVRKDGPVAGVFTVNFALATLVVLSLADDAGKAVQLARSRV